MDKGKGTDIDLDVDMLYNEQSWFKYLLNAIDFSWAQSLMTMLGFQ